MIPPLEQEQSKMKHKQIVRVVIVVVVIAAVWLIVQSLDLGPELAKALVTLHGGR